MHTSSITSSFQALQNTLSTPLPQSVVKLALHNSDDVLTITKSPTTKKALTELFQCIATDPAFSQNNPTLTSWANSIQQTTFTSVVSNSHPVPGQPNMRTTSEGLVFSIE